MKRLILAILLAGAGLCSAQVQETYRNPVINADVPDISVCKVQDTY